MESLPIAAFLAREGVERQFEPDQATGSTGRASRAATVRHTRVAVATTLDRAARAVAPAGYHPA